MTEQIQWQGLMGAPFGCFSFRTSRTVWIFPFVSTFSSRARGGPPSCFEISRNAALTLPSIISLAKECASFSSDLGVWSVLRMRCCIVRPSCSNPSRSPSTHNFIRRSRQTVCSFTFEDRCGFCSRRAGRVIAAVRATDSSGVPSA